VPTRQFLEDGRSNRRLAESVRCSGRSELVLLPVVFAELAGDQASCAAEVEADVGRCERQEGVQVVFGESVGERQELTANLLGIG
jgi:hypothetical protein